MARLPRKKISRKKITRGIQPPSPSSKTSNFRSIKDAVSKRRKSQSAIQLRKKISKVFQSTKIKEIFKTHSKFFIEELESELPEIVRNKPAIQKKHLEGLVENRITDFQKELSKQLNSQLKQKEQTSQSFMFIEQLSILENKLRTNLQQTVSKLLPRYIRKENIRKRNIIQEKLKAKKTRAISFQSNFGKSQPLKRTPNSPRIPNSRKTPSSKYKRVR